MKPFAVPHTLVLLFGIMSLAYLATWLVPPGAYEMAATGHGKDAVVPGTFQYLESTARLPVWTLLTVIPRAMADAKDIIFSVFIFGGVIAILQATGAIDAAIGVLLRVFQTQWTWLLFGLMFLFATFSATFGMAEEYIGFVGVLLVLCAALKLDAIVAVGTMVIGYAVGYGCAVLNPFTVFPAQEISGLQPGSGFWFRLLMGPPMVLIGFHHLWSYARRTQADPTRSLLFGVKSDVNISGDSFEYPLFRPKHAMVLGGMIMTLVLLVYGVIVHQWYLIELCALFLGLGIFASIVGGLSANHAAETFIKGAAGLTGTALLIGFARSIGMILEEGQVLHTIVHNVSTPLTYLPKEVAAIVMLFIQNLLNFFIPSGSGQAYATIPIMAPIGDLVGIERQVTVLAFQFGDGFTNMIVPTNPVLMGILGIAGIPYDRWFRFIWPLIIKLFIASAIIMVIAIMVGLK
ncbi:MAG: YfcC family protein [Planctomycetaceae bacterium]|nr:YfcC family protein [Planctomycetaceae bacterium]